MNKLFIRTMGCQMNEYDSNKMFDVLQHSHKLSKTIDENLADVLLINTCSIREKAEDKLFHQLGRWKKLKDKNPNIVIGVGGCVASQEGELILKRAPFVDIIFGPQTLHRLPNMLSAATKKTKSIDISFPEIEKFDNLPQTKTSKVLAFVSIMEGCSKYCTFCVVPYTRGEEISRPFISIIDEINNLAKQGVKEVNLLGQNVNSYQGKMDEEVIDLAFLLEFVGQIDGIERIRYTTSHPVDFNDRLIEVYRTTPELVSHLHLPVQSGSDNILSKMKRGHTALEYKARIKKLRKIRPDISISSDFIIGFPNESAADFDDTIKFINDIGFDKSFSFIYSPRPGTPASSFSDNIDKSIKKQRLNKVQNLINTNTSKISNNMLGTVQKVLVEKIHNKSEKLYGKTENMRNTHFVGNKNMIGTIQNVKIIKAENNSLIGELYLE